MGSNQKLKDKLMREIVLQNQDGVHIATIKVPDEQLEDFRILSFQGNLYTETSHGEKFAIYTETKIFDLDVYIKNEFTKILDSH